MPYKLGAVGLGHWFKRLQRAMEKDGRIVLHKAVGVTDFEGKKQDLEKCGITFDRYFKTEPFKPLPKEFFDDLDAVQIASHNQFHAHQTIQSLENEKVTITEKTFATNRESFEEVMKYIEDNGHSNRVCVHLHYLRKILTRELPKILSLAVKEYGKVTNVVATFFEEMVPEDKRRCWLFKPENGGIFLDWMHPVEILSYVCNTSFDECCEARLFIVNPECDPTNPTAAYAKFNIGGVCFTQDATATIRVGKCFPNGTTHKTLRFYFEKNGFLDLNYVSSEQEFNSDFRGTWQLGKIIDGKTKVIESGAPKGPVSYEFLVSDMVKMIEGGNPPLCLNDIRKIFEPVWQFQEKTSKMKPNGRQEDVQAFIKDGLEKSP